MKKLISGIIIISLLCGLSGCQNNNKENEEVKTTQEISTEVFEEDPTQEEMTEEVVIEKPSYNYKFDPYKLSWEYEELYGSEFMENYRRCIDAYLNYETSFECDNLDFAYRIAGAVYVNFPLFSSDAFFNYDIFYDEETKLVNIYYTSSSKEEHDGYIEAFVDNVKNLIESSISEEDNEYLKAIKLYTALSSSVVYDYEALEDAVSDVSPYRAIMDREGICQSFAGAYVFLLNQVGIEANTCGGLNYEGTIAHDWTIVKLGENYYYIDPTFENGTTVGVGLKYFGMTTDIREAEGDFDPEYFRVGITNEVMAKDYSVDDNLFEAFRNCYYYEIDTDKKVIICYDDMGETVEWSYDR